MLYDFYDDSTAVILNEIFKVKGASIVPDVVKHASISPSPAFRADPSVCAWPGGGRYPIGNEADVWLSAAYLSKTSHQIPLLDRPSVWAAVKSAADLFDVDISEFVGESSVKAASWDEVQDVTEDEVVKYAGHQFRPEELDVPEVFKTAQSLLEAFKRTGQVAPSNVTKAASAVALSSVVDSLDERMGFIADHNRNVNLLSIMNKSASQRGFDTVTVDAPYDSTFLKAYDELAKMAANAEIDENFWLAYETLDKLAGFHGGDVFVTPLHELAYRPIADDLGPKIAQLQGIAVDLEKMAQVILDLPADDFNHELAEHPRKLAQYLSQTDGTEAAILWKHYSDRT